MIGLSGNLRAIPGEAGTMGRGVAAKEMRAVRACLASRMGL
jgi:hypothetical protein